MFNFTIICSFKHQKERVRQRFDYSASFKSQKSYMLQKSRTKFWVDNDDNMRVTHLKMMPLETIMDVYD